MLLATASRDDIRSAMLLAGTRYHEARIERAALLEAERAELAKAIAIRHAAEDKKLRCSSPSLESKQRALVARMAELEAFRESRENQLMEEADIHSTISLMPLIHRAEATRKALDCHAALLAHPSFRVLPRQMIVTLRRGCPRNITEMLCRSAAEVDMPAIQEELSALSLALHDQPAVAQFLEVPTAISSLLASIRACFLGGPAWSGGLVSALHVICSVAEHEPAACSAMADQGAIDIFGEILDSRRDDDEMALVFSALAAVCSGGDDASDEAAIRACAHLSVGATLQERGLGNAELALQGLIAHQRLMSSGTEGHRRAVLHSVKPNAMHLTLALISRYSCTADKPHADMDRASRVVGQGINVVRAYIVGCTETGPGPHEQQDAILILDAFLEAEGLNVLLNAVESHMHDPLILQSSCQALHALTHAGMHYPRVQNLFSVTRASVGENLRRTCSCLAAAMSSHVALAPVQWICLATLTGIALQSSRTAEACATALGPDQLFRTLKNNMQHTAVVEQACRLSSAICAKCFAFRSALAETGDFEQSLRKVSKRSKIALIAHC
jgi:hypothetical protein